MKSNKILIFGLVLLIIFSISTASATDANATDIEVKDNLQLSEDNEKLSDVDFEVEEEENFVVGEDDYVTLSIPYDVDGNFSATIDGNPAGLDYDFEENVIYLLHSGGESFFNLPFAEDVYEDDTDPIEYYISLDKLTPNNVYNIVFTFKEATGEPTTKSSKITLESATEEEFDVEIDAEDTYIYNKSGNIITITAPESIIDSLDIKINDVAYQSVKKSSTERYVDISRLPLGTYNMVVSKDENTQECQFEVVNAIEYPEKIIYSSQGQVSLTLAEDAQGSLEVTIDGNIIGNVQLANGYAQVSIPNLSVGTHSIEAQYTGLDYPIYEVYDEIEVVPKITFPVQITAGDNKCLLIEVGDSLGLLTIYADYDEYVSINVNRSCKVSLANLDDGDVDLTVRYVDEDGYIFEEDYEITVDPAPVKIIAKNIQFTYGSSSSFKVKVYDTNAKVAAYDVVTIKFLNKNHELLMDNSGAARFSIPKTLAPGKYSIVTSFNGVSVKNTITVKHLVKLAKVKVKKSAKKLVLKATVKNVKNKKVVFKFKGKKYTARTNKKGVAKVTIKKSVLIKLKVGKKVTYQATYLKDTVKRTVKVKK